MNEGLAQIRQTIWLKFHLARLDSTRHVRLCRASQASRASRDERVDRARRAVLFQHGRRRTILYKFRASSPNVGHEPIVGHNFVRNVLLTASGNTFRESSLSVLGSSTLCLIGNESHVTNCC